ncbi:hypothetical protein T03_664 [Trichinella britovi]|uniref:Reverse transcriptase domain-containing protein n=1 Tax=Trichinella britovi TaxID=45882 RepID=A0A0V1C5H8_TRIBR|nr:hypothetical protein T03_664 [Trichinella britovi]
MSRLQEGSSGGTLPTVLKLFGSVETALGNAAEALLCLPCSSTSQVGFGLSCSSFLAMRVIRHHAQSHGKVKALADKDRSDMYVDDFTTSFDRIGQARTLIRKLCNLMKSGGFAVKKWASNDTATLSDLPVEVTPPLETSRLWKTLRLYWNRRLNVQRALVPVPGDQVGRSELHVFGDAAEAAYGAVAFLLKQARDGVSQVRFVLAKARVGPIKLLRLLRLELMASLLAA